MFTKKKLHILMISEHGDPLAPLGGQQSGGQNVYVNELSRYLSNLGASVDVFTRWENPEDEQIEYFDKHARVIRIEAGPKQFVPKESFGTLMPEMLENILFFINSEKISYDLIHSHYYFSGWLGVRLKKVLNIPLVITFHSLGLIKKRTLGIKDKSPIERTKIEKEVMKKADCIIAVSPDEKNRMIKEYKANKQKIRIIPPGVNLKHFRPNNIKVSRERLGIGRNKKVIVFAGKMEERKGGTTLIRAISHIKRDWPKLYEKLIVYIFSGDPRPNWSKKDESSAHDNLLSLINKMELGDKIILLPGVDQKTLHLYYGAANVVAVPSYYEPFGLVAAEAMATFTPVVASRVGGLKWSVTDGLTGFQATPRNAREFARKIVRILKNPRLGKRLSKNAYLRVRNKFNWFWNTREIINLYYRLINTESEKGK